MIQRGFPDILSKWDEAPLTLSGLKARILSNLSMLFGSHRAGLPEQEAEAFPHARDSVINFHVHDFSSGRFAPADYTEHLKWAIQVFETRLAKETLQVRHVEFKTPRPYWVFRIDADFQIGCGWNGFHCYLVIDLEGRTRIID